MKVEKRRSKQLRSYFGEDFLCIMSGHGHSHGGGCGGNHDCDEHMTEDQLAAAYSLYTKINMEAVQCLNTDSPAKCVFKPWDQRLDREKVRGRTLILINKYLLRCDSWGEWSLNYTRVHVYVSVACK